MGLAMRVWREETCVPCRWMHRSSDGHFAGCQAIRLFLPLHVHCKEQDGILFQTSHVNRLVDIRSDQDVSCDQECPFRH